MPNVFIKFVKITRFVVRLSFNIARFADIFPKHSKRAKNGQIAESFLSGKQFQIRSNLADLAF
jgi:hypothetical protein